MALGWQFYIVALCLPAAFALCPKPAVKEDFDLNQYLGTWYEIERNYNPAETSKHECGKTTISQIDSKDGYNVMFNTTWQYRGKLQNQVTKGVYNAEAGAKMKIKPIPFFPKQNYWVLDTDYENYSIVWSCAEFIMSEYQLLWIFSREKTMRPENRLKAYTAITDLGFKLKDLIVVKHENC